MFNIIMITIIVASAYAPALVNAAGNYSNLQDQSRVCLLDLQAYFQQNMYVNNSDIQGDTFVGGNSFLRNFEINGSLAVSGHLDAQNGTFKRDIKTGTNSIKRITKPFKLRSGIDLFTENETYFDQLARLSQHLTENDETSSVEIYQGVISLAASNPLNFFFIDASELQNAHKLTLDGNEQSVVVINIDSSTQKRTEFFRMTLEIGNLRPENIIYNFYNAEEVLLGMVGPESPVYGTGIQGTILAPYADVKFFMGVIDGGLYAKSLIDALPTGQIDPLKITNQKIRQIICHKD